MASESGEKHVEIERLELSDAPEQPAPVPSVEHQEPAPKVELPNNEEMAHIAQSELAADVGDLLS